MFEESHGDEWKTGTPYEDPEDRAWREVSVALSSFAKALGGLAEALKGLGGMAQNLAVIHATRQLMLLGMSEKEAQSAATDCAMMAAAEGRNVSLALKGLIQKRMRHPPTDPNEKLARLLDAGREIAGDEVVEKAKNFLGISRPPTDSETP